MKLINNNYNKNRSNIDNILQPLTIAIQTQHQNQQDTFKQFALCHNNFKKEILEIKSKYILQLDAVFELLLQGCEHKIITYYESSELQKLLAMHIHEKNLVNAFQKELIKKLIEDTPHQK